jgi:hypothetical protein
MLCAGAVAVILVAVFALFIMTGTTAAEPNRSGLIASIDCELVRPLTAIERWYWIKRFKISDAERRSIERRCNIK